MKHIFDELKKMIKMKTAHIGLKGFDGQYDIVLAEVAQGVIDEVEAKWESDCCIRVIGKPFTSSCGQKYDKWMYIGEPYCAKCGKRIKILEDE